MQYTAPSESHAHCKLLRRPVVAASGRRLAAGRLCAGTAPGQTRQADRVERQGLPSALGGDGCEGQEEVSEVFDVI